MFAGRPGLNVRYLCWYAPVGPIAGIRRGRFVRYARSQAALCYMSGIYACSCSRMGLCVWYDRAQVHRRRCLRRPSSDRYLNDDQCPRKYVRAAPEYAFHSIEPGSRRLEDASKGAR